MNLFFCTVVFWYGLHWVKIGGGLGGNVDWGMMRVGWTLGGYSHSFGYISYEIMFV
jgi:hypothetical protein